MKIAEVAVEKTRPAFDSLFSYRIPEGMDVKAGMRVVVPFGKGNKSRVGVVFKVTEGQSEGLKAIAETAEESECLSEEMLHIA